MSFTLTPEEALIQQTAKEFADKELAPLASKIDQTGEVPRAILEKMASLGFLGMLTPEAYGGAGLSNLALALVQLEINRACASTGVTLSVHNSLVCGPIKKFGTDAQKQAWLPKLAAAEIYGAYCLTEPNAGSDAAALETTARLDGDHWVLSGTKIWVTNGGIAGLFVVYARTDPKVSKAKGISAFLVPRDTPGVSIGKHEKKTGIRASSTTEVIFENARIPKDNLLGELNKGFSVAMDTLDGGRIGIASQSVGIARACLEASVKYSKEREQFGQPIANYQAIQWKLADMSTRIDASRLLTWKAAWLRDRGERCTQAASEAKLFASQTANFAADECLQIHGGAGYTDHFHVERLFRDARITEIYEGATDVQRIVIARGVLA